MEMYKVFQVPICGFRLHSFTRNEYVSTLWDKPCAGESYLILVSDNLLSFTAIKLTVHSLNRASWYTYVRKTNKMHTFS